MRRARRVLARIPRGAIVPPDRLAVRRRFGDSGCLGRWSPVSEWRFVLSRQWAGYLALTVIFAIACCALGTWQLNRRAEALAEVARIDANYDAEPVPVAEALPDPATFDIDQRW